MQGNAYLRMPISTAEPHCARGVLVYQTIYSTILVYDTAGYIKVYNHGTYYGIYHGIQDLP